MNVAIQTFFRLQKPFQEQETKKQGEIETVKNEKKKKKEDKQYKIIN